MMKRLAIITSHPIQYNAPIFRLLAQRGNIVVKVFYSWGESCLSKKFDPGFGRVVDWDIPLMDGYDYSFLQNKSRNPGSHSFFGIINPNLEENVNAFVPDAILIFGWKFHAHFKAINAYKGKVKLFFRGDSILEKSKSWVTDQVKELFLTKLYSGIDKFFYVGDDNKNYFKAFGVKDHKLVLAPHAIDNERFGQNASSLESEALAWRNQLGIQDDELCVLYSGKLNQNKNISFLVNTFIEAQVKNLKLLVVGEGALKSEIKEAAARCKEIIHLPFQNQQKMPLVYRLGDVTILPSLYGETWGLTLNESMACGRSVIASVHCGATKNLVNEDTGYTFNPMSSVELTEIFRILTKQQLKEKGVKAMEFIQAFNFERICEATEKEVMSV